ncbi:ABC transporter permease [Nocardioides currus]|uniref:Nitrate ABC transporter permease n=1 Tax=Nocardioides currus TaxID=2133958 RepID=A0A2R7YTW6_9ACTN|nr:ABC transporter permease subunit [Nocardioides currus]PUA79807.1 nitrate ABC transporter permease [Nocardioides currus]
MSAAVTTAVAEATRPRLRLRDLRLGTVLAPLVVGVVFLGGWQLLVDGLGIDPYIVPAPSAIWDQVVAGWSNIVDGMQVTGRNALIGMLVGGVIGVLGAILASLSKVVDQMAVPIVSALSVVPIVALAPVLYTMFGAAVDTGRIVVAALAVSIPVYFNTLRGLRQVSTVHRELMSAYAATPTQVIRTVTLPTATPYVFTGLRIASSLAVISALIAEYFGGPVGGLGKAITSAAASSNYPLAWAYVTGSIVLGLAFYVVTLLVELWFARHTPPTP